jgi:hypothetical protein
MENITTVGLDLAKSVFSLHGVDASGRTKSKFVPARPVGRRVGRHSPSHVHTPDSAGFGHSPIRHWITSARCSSDGGIVMPRALAVLRLMTSSNFVGCSMGSSAGLAPFKILST